MSNDMKRRIAVLTALIEGAPKGTLGRTAVMKLFYLLSAIRGVSVGYHFTLYAYGPFDSAVLEDIDYAARLGAVGVRTKIYPKGYGYEIEAGENVESARRFDEEFVANHRRDIEWTIREFGSATAAELELISTIVYVDREWRESGEQPNGRELAGRVQEIKQHFARHMVERKVENLRRRGMLESLDA